ncbi:hypothetical protein H2509_03370 [Stappia sp. F7233]|uniref:Tetratricopeptide repeat protein n=1 Tax=Stappia albiluteola TaxID=2758565 RepID=A0A839ABU5_9HYPH|nr:multiheme c-type cytochrome [Stappia albiluteola]MBA5776159.1 hypothetical protein [Stappia albiluteola]
MRVFASSISAAALVFATVLALGQLFGPGLAEGTGGGEKAGVSTPDRAATEHASYVGAETCAACHAEEGRLWEGSHHALAMQHANEATVLGDFADREATHGPSKAKFFRQGERFMVRTDGPDGKDADFEVRFTFGVEPLQQYLVGLPKGRLQALPFAWDSRPEKEGGQRWYYLYPGETILAGDELHWTGLQQNWNYMCADCHSTNLRRNFDPNTRAYSTTYSEINVACESCHGPGSDHVAWARQGKGGGDDPARGLVNLLNERDGVVWALDPATGNSTRSRPREMAREVETCAFCHARRAVLRADADPGAPIGDRHHVMLLEDGLYFPDGQIRDEVYEYGSFIQSRMFAAGVTCSDCHEPHSLKLRAEGNGVCLQCHAAEKFDVATHHHHKEESIGAQCVSCHMPERTYMVVDRRRDHSLRIPRPDLSVALSTPNACTNCHGDKPAQWAAEQVRSWHPDGIEGFQTYAETLAAGSAGAPGSREALLALAADAGTPAIARASALAWLDRIVDGAMLDRVEKLLADPDPLVRRSAVGAYRSVPQQYLEDLLPLLDDPVMDVRLEAARALATFDPSGFDDGVRVKREAGLAEYIAAQRAIADRPEGHHNLAVLFVSLGQTQAAEAELIEALAIDRNFVPSAVTLADIYRATGRDEAAGTLLKALVQRVPDAAAAHHALGLWYVRAGGREDALASLERAAALGSADPNIGYVYAVGLEGAGRRGEAVDQLMQVLSAHPYHRESLYAAALYLRADGRAEEGVKFAERLIELEPSAAFAKDLLRQLSENKSK